MATEAETKVATQTAAPAVANPAPLGLFSFASTTLVLSAANAQLGGTGAVGVRTALALALFVGGLAQLLVGMWEFKAGNTFGGVAFSSYGVFWLSFWAINHLESQLPAATAGTYGGAWYLLCWAIVTGILLLGTLRLNMGLVVVFLLLFITFLLLCIGDFSGSTDASVAGWFGIATALAAYYVGAAGVLASVGGFKLPVGGPIMKG
jgi:succinate-acetate transporter protein